MRRGEVVCCIICHVGEVVVAVVVAVFVVVSGMGPAGQVLRIAPSGSFTRFLLLITCITPLLSIAFF